MICILNVFALAAILATATVASADTIGSWAGTGSGGVAVHAIRFNFSSFTGATTSTGSIWVLADDTTDVYLNGHLLQAANSGPNGTCQTGQPNCTTPLLVTLSNFVNGTNVLEFDVSQTNLVSLGRDFYGSVTTPGSVPEPGTLLLLGTGLVGSAAALFLRMRSQ